jgi:hypothetical protein
MLEYLHRILDGAELGDLRRLVREQLVAWVREHAEFLPKYRAELDGSAMP